MPFSLQEEKQLHFLINKHHFLFVHHIYPVGKRRLFQSTKHYGSALRKKKGSVHLIFGYMLTQGIYRNILISVADTPNPNSSRITRSYIDYTRAYDMDRLAGITLVYCLFNEY